MRGDSRMARIFPAFTSRQSDTRDMLSSLQTSKGVRTSDGTTGGLDFIHDLTSFEFTGYALVGRVEANYGMGYDRINLVTLSNIRPLLIRLCARIRQDRYFKLLS
jgi:hypothetical protein